MIYFDHNATTPLLPEARQAWLDASDKFTGNPSSPHRLGARADNALNEAREKLAAFLGCHAAQIVFTSGATESNNTVLHHYARTLQSDSDVWISAIEHPCVLEPAQFHFGKRVRFIPATREGVIDLEWIEHELKGTRPGFVAVMAANNETGALQPLRDMLKLCREREVPFFCDAVQWLGKLPSSGLGECDWLTGSAHKFGGSRGVGFVKVPAQLSLVSLLRGGPQEEARRAGTENVAGVLAMITALEVREQQLAHITPEQLALLRDDFERRFVASVPGSLIFSGKSQRLWNTVSALMPPAETEQRWVVKLDKMGFAVSTGSACASGKEEPSHVLRAMGCSAPQAARALRFSAGWETTASDWDALLRALQTIHGNTSSGPEKILAKPAGME